MCLCTSVTAWDNVDARTHTEERPQARLEGWVLTTVCAVLISLALMTRRALLHCTLCRSNRNLDTTLLHCRAAICAECQLRSDVANYPLKSAWHSRPSIRYIMVVSVKCQKLSLTQTNLYRNVFFHSTNIHRLKLSCNNVININSSVHKKQGYFHY